MMTQTMGKKQRWSPGLPDDILQLIAQRLCISDYQAFRQVCPNWRVAVDRGIAVRSCPPAPQLPWLLLLDSYGLSSGNRDSLDAFYMQNQYSFLKSPTSFKSKSSIASYSRNCVGSVECWLMVAILQRCRNDKTSFLNFLFNPISRARVKLPSDNSFLIKTVASSPPAGMQQNNCFVAGLCYQNCLGICRPTDASWTLVDPICRRLDYEFEDLEITDQKLYVIGRPSWLLGHNKYIVLEYDILSEDVNVTRAEYNCSISIDVPHFPVRNYTKRASLVRDSASKELFLVLCTGTIREGVRVYKMKRESSDGKPIFEEVTDIGDRILFLSSRSNKVINDKTFGKNCIYFAFDLIDGFWVYSLTDMSLKLVNFPNKDYSSLSADTLWFTPHPW